MEWPNQDWWGAGRVGQLTVDDERFTLSIVPCGELALPSGRLLACDPLDGMASDTHAFVELPPGRYPVSVTFADVSESQDGSDLVVAYASIVVGPGSEVRRQTLTPLAPGQALPELAEGEFISIDVDGGSVCFVDECALTMSMPPEFEDVLAIWKGWFKRFADPEHIRHGLANISLPNVQSEANMVIFSSGWGDGAYPLVGGYNMSGELVAVHIDFFVLPTE